MSEIVEPHREMVDYLRDNTIFARHSRLETRDFLDRLAADGYAIVSGIANEPVVAPAEDETASHD